MYTLLNKRTGQKLTHPEIGLWHTNDLTEAKEMLKACYEYLHATGLDALAEDFVVVDVETNKQVE